MTPADPTEDQLEAAQRQANRILTGATDLAGGEITRKSKLGRALALRFADSLSPSNTNARICPHLVGGPKPFYAVASLPGMVSCSNCFPLLIAAAAQKDGAFDRDGRTCDNCGHRVEEGHTGIVQHGPLLLQVNLCCLCGELEDQLHEDENETGTD